MTPLEIQAEAEKFRLEIGEHAWLSVGIGSRGMAEKPCTATLYADGITKDRTLGVDAVDWPDLFVVLRATWSSRQVEIRHKTIRKMAMEVIRLTAEFGECTDAALRQTFRADEIKRYAADAIKDANDMAVNGPFDITFMPQPNLPTEA